jgi:RNA polymerase sigma factor (TIGR02999 family)
MMSEVTQILVAIVQGDAQATAQLFPLVYAELRELAARKLAQESPGQTLQATALVHEVYIRLVATDRDEVGTMQTWDSRRHFFAAAAEAMRRILLDHARGKRRLKRAGGWKRLQLDHIDLPVDELPQELLDLDEALQKLAQEDALCAELVKLRFFAGLTLEETASALGIGRRTADRYWVFARSWLYDELRAHDEAEKS